MKYSSFDTVLGRIDQIVNITLSLPELIQKLTQLIDYLGGVNGSNYSTYIKENSITAPNSRENNLEQLRHEIQSAFRASSEYAVSQQVQIPHEMVNEWAHSICQATQSTLAIGSVISLLDGFLTRKKIDLELNQTRKLIREQSEEIKDILQEGFTVVHQDLERLNSHFHWGFGELIWRLDQQTEQTKDLIDILTNPLEIQVKELRERGIECYNYGWYPEALEFLHEAMNKSRIDYIVAHYLGNIYLYEYGNYEQALSFFSKAARFSQPKSSKHYVYALMSQGYAYYLRNDEGDIVKGIECLSLAMDRLPGHLEARYQYAVLCAAAKRYEEAVESISYILHADPFYMVKILAEPEFSPISEEITQLVNKQNIEYRRKFVSEFEQHKVNLDKIQNAAGYTIGSGYMQKPEQYTHASIRLEINNTSHSGPVQIAGRTEAVDHYLRQIEQLLILYENEELISSYLALNEIVNLPLPKQVTKTYKIKQVLMWGQMSVTGKTGKTTAHIWSIGGDAI